MWDNLIKNYSKIGNIVHDSVPLDNNEDNNKVERTWGEVVKREINGKPGSAHHHEVLNFIGGYDHERGQKVAGHRGYYLKGYGVLLNQALIQYGMRFLHQKGYAPVQPPYFMKREIMAETAQLSDFDDQLYKIEGDTSPLYLIATAEQPISTMYKDEWLEKAELPIRYAGISPCFRKEAGAAGKDCWGIFRVHQFEKVEQFVISSAEDSWAIHEEMIKISEEFYQSLKLPYRVINIVSGALNDAASKKYDLEAWFPGYDTYRELVSCSNCTDYQSRSINIRLRTDKKQSDEKKYVHMLNGTLTATERTLCCILENYQTETGLKVPEPLIPFVGTDFIPYVKERLPGFTKEEDKKDKKKKDEKKSDK
jgi:seryl-tRNA synthetase